MDKKIFLVQRSFSEKRLQEKLEGGGNVHFDWFHATEGFMYYAHDKLAKETLLKAIETKPLYWFYSEDIDGMILDFLASFLKSFLRESFVELTFEELLFMKLLVKNQDNMNKLELGTFLNLVLTVDKEALLKKLSQVTE